MTLVEFLDYILSPVGAGVAVWGLLAFIIKLVPALDQNGNLKFWLAMALSFVLPLAGYWGRIALGLDVFDTEGIFLAIGAGYLVSQGFHRGSEQLEKKLGAN